MRISITWISLTFSILAGTTILSFPKICAGPSQRVRARALGINPSLSSLAAHWLFPEKNGTVVADRDILSTTSLLICWSQNYGMSRIAFLIGVDPMKTWHCPSASDSRTCSVWTLMMNWKKQGGTPGMQTIMRIGIGTRSVLQWNIVQLTTVWPHANTRIHTQKANWYPKLLSQFQGIASKDRMGQISKNSVSFHLKQLKPNPALPPDNGMRYYYAVLYGKCK